MALLHSCEELLLILVLFLMNLAHTPLVYIVDDEPALRDALLGLLKSVGLQALAVADIEAMMTAYQPQRPGCLLLGIQGHPDLGAQQCLREQGIDLPVIIIAGHSDVSLAVNAMKQGVLDFIEKPFNDQLLLDGVHHALAEDTIRRRSRARHREFQQRFDTLTPREQDVLRQVAEGLSNQDIAEVLKLSRKTVEVHRAKVMDKMQADTLAQLLRMTLTLGILQAL